MARFNKKFLRMFHMFHGAIFNVIIGKIVLELTKITENKAVQAVLAKGTERKWGE